MKRTLLTLICLAVVFSPCLFSKAKVGEIVVQTFETPHPYDGGNRVVWEKEFHWDKAGYIAVHFSRFELAGGDYVEISSPDGKFNYVFKDKGKDVKDKKGNKKQISEFWATHIPGDTAIVRLVSKSGKGAFGVVVDKWAHGYERGFIDAVLEGLEEDAGVEDICTADDKEWARCYDGTAMYDESRAVCRLLIDGNTACTGFLVGSEGHVMTNEHCIDSQTLANNTDYEFMAEGSTCATDCSSWGACPGTVEASAGTLIKVDYALDYSLILLPANVTSTYGYMQFRDTLATVGERIYVPQHPGHYGKQLAVDSDVEGPYAKIQSTNQTPCHGGPGDIGYYADTSGGSSGAPVLAYADNLVVALHHCGSCPNRGVPVTAIISDLGVDLPADAVPGGTPPVVEYCTSYSKNQNYEWIARVQVGNLDNGSGASAYSGYTDKTANLTAGSGVSVTLTPGYAGKSHAESWKIWIDYNDDGDFSDAGEEVFTGSGSSAVTGNFTVPSSAAGQLRMRIVMSFGVSPASCGSFIYGEVEDYTVDIQ